MMPKLQASSWGRNDSVFAVMDTPTGLKLASLSPEDMDTDANLCVYCEGTCFKLFQAGLGWFFTVSPKFRINISEF